MGFEMHPGQTMARLPSLGCSLFTGLFGLLLVPLGFFLVYYGETRLVNHGKVVERVPMMTVEQAQAVGTGTVKFRGKPEGEFLKVPRYDRPVVYFRETLEQYEQERNAEGEVEYDWNTRESKSQFVPFRIGGLRVSPERAKVVGAQKVFEGLRPADSPRRDFAPMQKSSRSPRVGDERLTLWVIPAHKELLVFGDLVEGTVAGGSTFVVSALDEAGTIRALKTEYSVFYWLIKGGAVLAIGLGLWMMFGPLLTVLGHLPFVGSQISCLFAAAAFLFAILVVALVTLLIKFAWVIGVVSLVVLGVGIVLAVRVARRRTAKVAG